MHCLLFYDVNKERVQKLHRYLSRRLFWRQNSVFEGELTAAQRQAIITDTSAFLDPGYDSLLFLCAPEPDAWEHIALGPEKGRLFPLHEREWDHAAG